MASNKLSIHEHVAQDSNEYEKEIDNIETDNGFTSPKKQDFLRKMILVWISRAIPICAAFGAICFMLYLAFKSSKWSIDSSSSDIEILSRESTRGQFFSIFSAILLNIIGAYMFHIGVKEGLVVTNYGFILGPVVNYMFDRGIASDIGLRNFMTLKGFEYTFASLISGNFMRYIITVFLDLFISNPLQDIIKRQAKSIGVIEELKQSNNNKHKYLIKYDHFVAINFPSILQSIVGIITFQAYTNQTRFAWAYPTETLDRELRIPPGTIMLSTAISGVLYLNFYTIMDYISDREYFDVNTKILYVLTILLLLYGLNETQSIEAPIDGEIDIEITAVLGGTKPFFGFIFFIGFVLYGFIYPIWTRLGCCGYCKPTPKEMQKTDHIILEPINDALPNQIVLQIKNQISMTQQITNQ